MHAYRLPGVTRAGARRRQATWQKDGFHGGRYPDLRIVARARRLPAAVATVTSTYPVE